MNKLKISSKAFHLFLLAIFIFIILFSSQIISSSPSSNEENLDSDNDGINDSTEKVIGSNHNDSSDVSKIKIENKDYFLIDSNSDKIFDKLYDPIGKMIQVSFENGEYLIDINQDNTYEYVYSSGDISVFKEEVDQLDIPWILVIASIIIIVLIVILILFKLGILYLYEEYVDE